MNLEAKGLIKSYGRRMVVREVCVEVYVKPVKSLGFLGSQRRWKTTCFQMITWGSCGRMRGNILLNGENVTRKPMYERARLGIRLSGAGALDIFAV